MERKEAIKVVKSNLPDDGFAMLREALETLIPELKESEGERIRKWIIDDIRYNMHEEPLLNTEYKRKGEKAIAWLESLGEGIPSKETILNVWDLGNIWKEITNGASNTEHGTQLDYIIKHWKEGEHYVKEAGQEADGWKEGDVIKYGDSSIVRALVIKGRMAVKSNGEVFTVQYPDEWVKVGPDEKEKFLNELEMKCGRLKWKEERGKKPADKSGPKFSVGEWVVANDGKGTFLINDINCSHCTAGDVGIISIYCSLEDTEGAVHYPCLLSESRFHPWTIEDAEDGDVLVDEDNNIGIYKERDDLNWSSYIYLGCDNRLHGFSIGGYHNYKNTRPATKKQREILFQKMEEVGYEWMSKKSEQESTNKAEPKFKPGDWVIGRATENEPRQIAEVTKDGYKTTYGGWIGSSFEDDMHLWAVQDAKDGDVLINRNDEVPFIFKGFLDQGHPDCPVAYCGIDDSGEFRLSSGDYFWEDSNVKPATKEQRDFLFSKMREAGYEWDAVSKLLNRLL